MKTPKPATQAQIQKAFDLVVNHLLTQGERATTQSGRCMYRTPDGRQCALGILIKDEYYREDLESKAWVKYEQVRRAISDSLGFELPMWFGEILQSIHDDVTLTDGALLYGWRAALRQFAKDYNLQFNDLTEESRQCLPSQSTSIPQCSVPIEPVPSASTTHIYAIKSLLEKVSTLPREELLQQLATALGKPNSTLVTTT